MILEKLLTFNMCYENLQSQLDFKSRSAAAIADNKAHIVKFLSSALFDCYLLLPEYSCAELLADDLNFFTKKHTKKELKDELVSLSRKQCH